MKYLFEDAENDGCFIQFLEATPTEFPSKNSKYRLEIDHNLDVPFEEWRLIQFYIAHYSGVPTPAKFVKTVYYGKSLTDEQRDMMVELVMEHEYLDFGKFKNNESDQSTK